MSERTRTGPDTGTRIEARRLLWWLVVPVLALLAVLSVLQVRQRLEDSERQLQRRADERAQDLQALARPAESHVNDMRRLLETHWDDPPDAGPALRRAMRPWRAPSAPDTIDGWTLDEAGDAIRQRYGQIWWGSRREEPPPDVWLNRAALLQGVARVVLEREPGFEGSYFVSTETNVSWAYPWQSTGGMLRTMGVGSLRALDGLREASFEASIARFAVDPGINTRWSRPYVSQQHNGLVISHSAGVVHGGKFLGDVSVDVRLDDLQALVDRWRDGDTRVWVVDRQLRVLADTDEPLKPPAGDGNANQPVIVQLSQRLTPEAIAALAPGWSTIGAASVIRDQGMVLITAGRPGAPWLYVQAVPASRLIGQTLPSLLPNAVIAVALLVAFVSGQWLFARWFVEPSLRVLDYLRQLSTDASTPEPQVGRRWQGWVRAVRDTIQRQQRAFQQVEEQREALRQSEKLSAMGTLLAGVAHELNNPLAIVTGRAVLLEERVNAPGPRLDPRLSALQDDARRIRTAAERCGRIVRTFLNMARQRPPARRPVPLAEVVRSAADMLGYTLRSHGVRLVLAVPDDLPPAQADPDQLGQVILNLMVNAQQAMADVATDRVLTVSAGTQAPPPEAPADTPAQLWLRVADTGHGVPESLRDNLFEPFFTTKDVGKGTGLGLSMSRTIAREHGGDLTLDGSSSAGSCFLLTLPLPLSSPRIRDDEATPSTAADPASDGAPMQRLLVVDDEPEIAEIMRSILENAGYEVATAESAAVALELLDTARFDAVISDVRMPDLDGLGLWRAVRDRHPALSRRWLFVTGDTLSAQARHVLEETDSPGLDKPVDRDDLLRTVQTLLRG